MKRYEIVKNGKSPFHIVGANLSSAAERHAASELQKYIYESTNVLVPYFSDRCERRGAEIIIGYTTRDGKDRITPEELSALGEEGFIIRGSGEDIIISGATPRGTLYGVYRFLEIYLGFRAFTKDVEKIDKLFELIIEEPNVTETPDFEYRDAYFRFAFDSGFASKNRLNSTLAELSELRGGGMKFFNCHHSFDDLVPPKLYFEDHPEYYSEIQGKRSPRQLCLSNDTTLEIATETVRRWIKENPLCRVFSVAQNDNGDFCSCEKCRAFDEAEGSSSASVIRFVNKIAENIEKDYPNVLIHTFAYMHTRKPPKTVKPKKNVIVRLCTFECQWSDPLEVIAEREPESVSRAFLSDLSGWAKICDRLYIWDYVVNFRQYLQPFPVFYTMAENIRLYRRIGVRGALMQGNFSYGGGAAMDELKSYIIARLLWNADEDVDTLIKEFTDGVFGRGAKYIREYLSTISSATKGYFMRIYDYPDAPYLSDELIKKCDELFRLAEESERGECKRRIEREHLSIKYLLAARLEDDSERSAAIDALEAEIRDHKLTEIMERTNLDDSFAYLKRSRYGYDREGRYNMYYIIR